MKNYVLFAGSLLAASVAAGCGDDTVNPFVFEAGANDATRAADSGPDVAVVADDSGNDALPE